jgi:hypothetical protein
MIAVYVLVPVGIVAALAIAGWLVFTKTSLFKRKGIDDKAKKN